jgi:hypothetical protein
MSNKNFYNENLVSNLTDEQLNELLAYTPKFSPTNLANIKTRAFDKINTPQKKISVRKITVTLIAAAMLLLMSTAVFAAVRDIDLGQVFASFFNNQNVADVMEIGKTIERNGIEITVLYAYTDGVEAYAMLKLRDVEAHRLGSDLRLIFDMNSFAHIVTPIVYDETQNEILLGISMSRFFNPLDIYDEIFLSVESVLAGAGTVFNRSIDFCLGEHAAPTEMIDRYYWEREVIQRERQPDDIWDGIWGGAWSDIFMDDEPEKFLKVGETEISIPGIDWAVITNIGFYNGFLHLQTRRTDTWCFDSNHGWLNVIDMSGNSHWPDFNLNGQLYTESLFYVGEAENLAQMSLVFGGVMAEETIHGPWSFTFPVTALAERISFTTEISDSRYFKRFDADISPMATTIFLAAKDGFDDITSREFLTRIVNYVDIDNSIPYITLKDGSKIELHVRDTIFGMEGGTLVYTSLYFNVSQIYSITIMGVEYRM